MQPGLRRNGNRFQRIKFLRLSERKQVCDMIKPLHVVIRKHSLAGAIQVIDTSDITKPNGYISQEIYEVARELGLDEGDASYMVELYNQDLLFWGTGYYAELRGIPWEVWKELRNRFEEAAQ